MDWFYFFIGEAESTIEWWQMSIRAVLLFSVALALVRLGGKRIFGKSTVLDIVLAVVLGSNFSRALTGNAPFLPVIIASALLVLLHDQLARHSRKSEKLADVVKGKERKLVEDGKPLEKQLRRAGIGQRDLDEAMRLQGLEPDIEQVAAAYLERSGDISIIPKKEIS